MSRPYADFVEQKMFPDKPVFELVDDGGVIASPFDNAIEASAEFDKLCKETFKFKTNVKVIEVKAYLT